MYVQSIIHVCFVVLWDAKKIYPKYVTLSLCEYETKTKYLKSDYTKDLSLSICETPGGKTSIYLQLPTGEGAPMRMEKIYNPAPRAVGCVNTEKSPRRIGQTDATQELALLA